MPSVLVGNISGGTQLFSGWPYSGRPQLPVGGVQLRWDPNASGYAYVALSGGVTINSGTFFLSGGSLSSGTLGIMDGFPLKPGDPYFLSKLNFPVSGLMNIWIACDAAASGQARMYYEIQ